MKIYQFISIIIIGLVLTDSLSYKKVLNVESPKFKAIIKEMNLENKETITKNEFREIMLKLITKDKTNEKATHFNEGVVDNYIEDIDDELQVSTLAEQLDYDKFIESIKQTVRVQFGEMYVDQVTNAILEAEQNIDKEEEQIKKDIDKVINEEEKVEEL